MLDTENYTVLYVEETVETANTDARRGYSIFYRRKDTGTVAQEYVTPGRLGLQGSSPKSEEEFDALAKPIIDEHYNKIVVDTFNRKPSWSNYNDKYVMVGLLDEE